MLTDDEKLTVMKLIHVDPHLSQSEKILLTKKIKDNQEQEELIHGVAGGAVGFGIAKFLQLSKSAQVLLTLAGYGIGKYLLDNTHKSDKLLEYNDKTKTYKINP
jgi:hypothetical protein